MAADAVRFTRAAIAPVAPSPYARLSWASSVASSASVIVAASAEAASRRFWAAMKQEVRSRSDPGMARTSLRRSRTCSSPASARARPM